MSILVSSEKTQKKHFDNIISQYEAHYGDIWSQKYRLKFVYNFMFENISLSGCKILDAMCGSGQCTEYLLSKGALVTGLDISEEAIHCVKKRWLNISAVQASILDSGLESDSFDCVMIFTGLHHLHPHVNEAIDEIWRILKPGGYFCFIEPHSGSLPDFIRKLWYKYDHFFEENEASVDLDILKDKYSQHFSVLTERYIGNVGYLFVFQSMILRIPLRLKSLYAPFFLRLERIINVLQGKRLSCAVICQWQKT